MKSARFKYVRAASIADALAHLESSGGDARLLAGGQTLLPTMAFRLSEPALLIDIGRLEALKGITRAGDFVRIGAAATHVAVGAHALVKAHVPLLAEAVPHIAHAAIRNRGTLGGSLAYADPAAELPACAVVLGARIVTQSRRGSRTLPARDFFTGLFETALQGDELIEAVEFPVASGALRHGFYEIVRRSGDYAMAGAVTTAEIEGGVARDVRAVLFGVADVPLTVAAVTDALTGHPLTPERVATAITAARAAIDPTPDQHGSAATKRHLAGVALGRALARMAGQSRTEPAA